MWTPCLLFLHLHQMAQVWPLAEWREAWVRQTEANQEGRAKGMHLLHQHCSCEHTYKWTIWASTVWMNRMSKLLIKLHCVRLITVGTNTTEWGPMISTDGRTPAATSNSFPPFSDVPSDHSPLLKRGNIHFCSQLPSDRAPHTSSSTQPPSMLQAKLPMVKTWSHKFHLEMLMRSVPEHRPYWTLSRMSKHILLQQQTCCTKSTTSTKMN